MVEREKLSYAEREKFFAKGFVGESYGFLGTLLLVDFNNRGEESKLK